VSEPRFTVNWDIDDECAVLIDHARCGRIVGRDGGEPEDQSLGRDWSWVADALNEMEQERIEAREAGRRAGLEEAAALLDDAGLWGTANLVRALSAPASAPDGKEGA
jgi:hypothetical protein